MKKKLNLKYKNLLSNLKNATKLKRGQFCSPHEKLIFCRNKVFTFQTITPINSLHSGAFFIDAVHLHYVVLVLSKGNLKINKYM